MTSGIDQALSWRIYLLLQPYSARMHLIGEHRNIDFSFSPKITSFYLKSFIYPGKYIDRGNSIELNPVFMYLVYSQQKQLGSGTLTEAARIAKEHSESAGVIVFDEATFQPVDLDLSGCLLYTSDAADE